MPDETNSGTLELYDRAGLLLASIPATRDERDPSKWHLAESVSLGDREAESAVLRFGDGTSQPVPATVFPTSVAVNTLFITPE